MNCKFCKADCVYRGEDREKECRGHIPMTNANRIRAMSDEELAWELRVWQADASAASRGYQSVYPQNHSAVLAWLQQPAEEVHHE